MLRRAEVQDCPSRLAPLLPAPRPGRLGARASASPHKCHQRRLGPELPGSEIFPSCPLDVKDVILCCLAFVLKMSSESLGGRGYRALLPSTVTTIFCILKNMTGTGEGFFFFFSFSL